MTNPFQDVTSQTLFDAVLDAMLLVDESGRVVLANSVARQLLGYPEEEIIGLEVEALMPQQYRAHHRHYREAFNKNPEKRSMGSRVALVAQARDGKELEVDIGLSPFHAGKRLYTLVTFYIADKRRQSEASLRISEERLRLAKQAAGISVFDFDSKHKTLQCDEQMCRLWGADYIEQLNNKRFSTLIHPEDRTARQSELNRVSDPDSNREYHAEYRVINPADNSIRWVSAVGKMHFENGCPTRLIGIAHDITERKLLENKLQRQRAEAETLFTQQVASQTASAIAHELNQPLAAISAYSEVALHALENDTIDQNSLKRALEGCVKQAQRAGGSLHELMAFLQKGDLIRESLNLNEIVSEAVNIAKSNGYGKFHPVLQLEPDIPYVLGNRTQVLKILVNLLRNSVEAMHDSGMPLSTITITVRTNTNINMAHVTVQDSGPGMDPDTARRIFEPFFSTKPSGIGMGLAISRALAEANGGQLWLDPSSDSGATFHFTLPFAS